MTLSQESADFLLRLLEQAALNVPVKELQDTARVVATAIDELTACVEASSDS